MERAALFTLLASVIASAFLASMAKADYSSQTPLNDSMCYSNLADHTVAVGCAPYAGATYDIMGDSYALWDDTVRMMIQFNHTWASTDTVTNATFCGYTYISSGDGSPGYPHGIGSMSISSIYLGSTIGIPDFSSTPLNATSMTFIPDMNGAGFSAMWRCINVTSWIAADTSNGFLNSSFRITPTGYDSDGVGDWMRIYSMEYATVSYRPYLNVTYTTTAVPSTIMMLVQDSCTYSEQSPKVKYAFMLQSDSSLYSEQAQKPKYAFLSQSDSSAYSEQSKEQASLNQKIFEQSIYSEQGTWQALIYYIQQAFSDYSEQAEHYRTVENSQQASIQYYEQHTKMKSAYKSSSDYVSWLGEAKAQLNVIILASDQAAYMESSAITVSFFQSIQDRLLYAENYFSGVGTVIWNWGWPPTPNITTGTIPPAPAGTGYYYPEPKPESKEQNITINYNFAYLIAIIIIGYLPAKWIRNKIKFRKEAKRRQPIPQKPQIKYLNA